MSAIEIIEQLKILPLEDKKTVRAYLEGTLTREESQRLYDDFTVLGNDTAGCDVSYAEAAQAEVIRHAG
jgi:hypothetical protein